MLLVWLLRGIASKYKIQETIYNRQDTEYKRQDTIYTLSPCLAHTKNIFIRLKILPFKKMVIHRIAIQMLKYKYNNGNIPKARIELFTLTSSNHSYNTRNQDEIPNACVKQKIM